MLAIEIKDVAKKFGSEMALRNVSLQVEEGEIYGFLGPNGSGKTTTIRCIMDFIRPSKGSIRVFAKDAQKDSVAIKKKIGYLPSDGNLYDKWTSEQHIKFVQSIRRDTKKIDDLISRLNLITKKQVRHMSTGNKQKLGLILALIGSPKLLLLDEPTKGLDPVFQNEMYAILREFAADGGTVFLSSHNLSEVERICSDVGVIREGKLVASKSMKDIRDMKTYIVTATFEGIIQPDELKLHGVEVVEFLHNRAVMRVRGDLSHLIIKLGMHKLKDLGVTHASLEDIFMEYYRREK